MDIAFVYILRCADGSFYTGITRRTVEARVSEHNAGLVKGYTAKRRPVELIYSEAHLRYDEAVAAERRIKGWSRAKKVALMTGHYDALKSFATSYQKNNRPRAEQPPEAAGRSIGKDRALGLSFDSGASHPAQDEVGVEEHRTHQ